MMARNSPWRREAPRRLEKARLKANSVRARAGEAAVADAAADRASAPTGRRVSWGLRASQARRVPRRPNASRRDAKLYGEHAPPPSREDRQNGDARESRPRAEEDFAGEAPARSRRESEPVFSAIPAEPATSASASAQPEAEQASGPPRKGWWRR